MLGQHRDDKLTSDMGDDLAILWIDSHPDVGAGAEPHGLTRAQVRRIVADIDEAVDVVGFRVAEFIRRQVIHLQRILDGFPLIKAATAH